MSIGALGDSVYTEEEKRRISIKRAAELRKMIKGYLEKRSLIKTGYDIIDEINSNKEKLLNYFHADEDDWNNWQWQMSHRIHDASILSDLLGLSPQQGNQIRKVEKKYRWSISPYYASLIQAGSSNDPIMLQSVPSIYELDESGYNDPMSEEFTSPAPCITRRYPDRLIINVTNQCAMYCRHCQRRRNIGEVDRHQPLESLQLALEYIRKNKEIRDVLITGGDPFLLSNNRIDWLLTELDKINHVEIKRLGTRTLVTLPQRVTPELCTVLKKHPPLYVNTQFNHPREITPDAKKSCDSLVEAGVLLGNQAVLLKGINDDPDTMKKLNHELLKMRVRPYYIFHAKAVKGTRHFITGVNEGMEIIKQLRGFTSGLAVPTYIINTPHGYGKVPLLPRYLRSKKGDWIQVRNWEGQDIEFSLIPEN
ncbi:MAG: glutamate 2,3-aminomutase [Bacillota bacterium]|jgi:glutamate 2,3-aminomutase